jgi:hypothetical protein
MVCLLGIEMVLWAVLGRKVWLYVVDYFLGDSSDCCGVGIISISDLRGEVKDERSTGEYMLRCEATP